MWNVVSSNKSFASVVSRGLKDSCEKVTLTLPITRIKLTSSEIKENKPIYRQTINSNLIDLINTIKMWNQTDQDIDSIVTGVYLKHRFTSVGLAARFSRLDESEVEKSVNRLVKKNVLYQSVSGVPRRYSLKEPKKNFWGKDSNGQENSNDVTEDIQTYETEAPPTETVIHN